MLGGAGALQQAGQLGEDAGGVALGGGRLARREPHLAGGQGETGHRVHHQDHVGALVAEVLGHRRGQIGGADAQQGRAVAGGHDDHAARQALGAQVALDEFAHLAAALAHQADDADVGGGVAGHHAHEGALAHAGAGEDAHALALAQGKKRVDRPHAHVHRLGDAPAAHGGRRVVVQGVEGLIVGVRASVQGLAQAVDDPAQELRPHLDLALDARRGDQAAGAQAACLGVGHDEHGIALETHHLAQHRRTAVHVQKDAGAHRQHQALGLGHQAHHLADPPQMHQGIGLADGLAVVA